MSRKGISAAEKNSRLLAFFQDSRTFFSLKEVERQGAKATGINGMQIKDVLQALVDDGLVRCEKIGSGNYYWSFPSDASRGRVLKLEGLRKKVAAAMETVSDLEIKLGAGRAAREDIPERDAMLKEVTAKEQKVAELTDAIEKYSDSDPERLERMKTALRLATEAANRWTENIYAVIGYFKERGTDPQVIYQEFRIPPDLDTF